MGTVELLISKALKLRPGIIVIQIEIAAKNSVHEYAFAKDATAIDPARRIALQISGTNRDDKRVMHYPRSSGVSPIFRANTMADKLLNGDHNSIIATRERRFLPWDIGKTGKSEQEKKGRCYEGGHTADYAEALRAYDAQRVNHYI